MHGGGLSNPVIALWSGAFFEKAEARAKVTFARASFSQAARSPLRPLRLMRRPLGFGYEESRSSFSPHVVDHETTHDRAEGQAIGVRPRVCSLRRFDFEHEGKKRPVGRADQSPSGFRLAEFADEGNRGSTRVRFREAPENRARPLAGAIGHVEEPVALVAGAAELWSGEGAPCLRRRDRAPIGGCPWIKSSGGVI
jgi:hypothetical protein